MMANPGNTVIYTGVTNDLLRRVSEHKQGDTKSFTSRYHLTKLVYYESTPDVYSAISREKQIKGGSRAKKEALVNLMNSEWIDMAGQL